MESKEYYQALAEMYAHEHDEQLKPIKQLLIVKGVLYSMEDDLLAYKAKGKVSKRSEERLAILMEFVESISHVTSQNNQLRLMLKNSIRERAELTRRITQLEKIESWTK